MTFFFHFVDYPDIVMERYMKKFVFLLLFGLFGAHIAGAEVINGGVGLNHTRAAWVAEKGYLTVMPNARFWGKVSKNETDENNAFTMWVIQGLTSINYGIKEHFAVNFTPILYQDMNQGDKNDQYPWDAFLSLKIADYGVENSPFRFGVELATRLPLGERHNARYEDYTAGSIEFGFNALVSYTTNVNFPMESLNAHLNLGYWNHNDVGEKLLFDDEWVGQVNRSKYVNIVDPSQAFRFALGAEYPTSEFDYALEIYGNSWIQAPPEAAASREGYTYMNASITYKPYTWFDFIVSADVRLSPDKEETLGPRISEWDLPNYSPWRMNIGAKFILLPTRVHKVHQRDELMRKAEERRDVFEQIINERKETESAEQELLRIQQEREKAEKELDRLKRILEGKEEPDTDKQAPADDQK